MQDADKPMAIPDEIRNSLCTCGGIDGLVERLPEDEEFASLGMIHGACADAMRLKILAMLSIQPLCVCVIRSVLDIADSKLSYHLNVLKKAGLVSGDQKGNWIIYSLTDEGKNWAPVSQEI